MHPKVEEAIQEIDAALFSGDAFHNDEERIQLRELLSRWQRKVDEIEELKASDSAPNDEDEDPRSSYCDHGAAQVAEDADMEPPRDTNDTDAPTMGIDGFTAAESVSERIRRGLDVESKAHEAAHAREESAEETTTFLDECNYGRRDL